MSTIDIKNIPLTALLAIAALVIPQRAGGQTPMVEPEASSPSLGLCENAWDFNAPFGVPGFGPLRPNDIEASLALIQIGGSPVFAGEERLASRSLKRDALHIQR